MFHLATSSGTRGRRRVLALAVALSAGATLLPSGAHAGQQDACIPPTPTQAVEAIRLYLGAFLDNDIEHAMAVPLAEDVRRTNLPPIYPQRLGGPVTARSADQLRHEYWLFPTFYFLTGYGGLRLFLDGCSVVGFVWMNFQTTDMEPPPGLPTQVSKYFLVTPHIGLRARISGGLIEELELLQYRSEGSAFGMCWPADGDPNEGRSGGCARQPTTDPLAPATGCVPGSREQTMAPALAYIEALKSRDASGVPLADTARRTEMPFPAGGGPVTGTSGAEIRNDIENGARQPMTAIRNLRWTVEQGRCAAIVHWLGDLSPSGTFNHITRFKVSGGLIHEIEDIVVAPITPGAIEGSCWPRAWPDVEDETYRAVACPPRG